MDSQKSKVKSQMLNFVRSLGKLLWPKQPIAGLEIKDAALRIALFKEDGSLRKISSVLEPGIINEKGEINDRTRLIENLKKLKQEFQPGKEKISAVIIVPAVLVYAKSFNMPPLSPDELERSARLNLESISPIDFQSSHADWQLIKKSEKDNKLELLGAFARQSSVDSYVKVLEESGFLPVAVEFSALSLARAVKEYGVDVNLSEPQVLVNVSSDGIDFLVIQSGDLYFEYFTPWKLLPDSDSSGREILFEDFKQTILREIKRVATFYGGHWGGRLGRVILVTQALNKEISEFISQNLSLEVTSLKLAGFSDLSSSWFPVIGGALRGKISRAKDDLISLMAIGTETGYFHNEIKIFVKMWRSVILTTLVFLAILFIAVDSLLARYSVDLAKQSQDILRVPGGEEIAKLQEQARAFNQFVDKALIAKEQSRPWSEFFINLNNLAANITIVRISVNSLQSTASIVGTAPDEARAIEFKNKLIQNGFRNVSLPLSEIRTNPTGEVSFSLSFSL